MILTIGPGGCGFTFVNWSIAYLRGDQSYRDLSGILCPVDINPLDGFTAHNFKKDHLKIEISKNLLKQATDHSIIYITPGSHDDFKKILDLPGKKIIFDHRKYPKELLARSFMTMPRCGHGIEILLDFLERKYPSTEVRRTLLENAKLLVQYYKIPHDDHYFLINYENVFQTFDLIIEKLFDFLEIKIDRTRIENWRLIYQQYKAKNQDFITKFVGDPTDVINHSLRRSIFKEIYNWTRGGHHLISLN